MPSSSEANLSVDPRRSVASGAAGPSAAPGVRPVARIVDALAGGDSRGAMTRHRLEFAEPSIWIWRRIVGAAFAFIVVTLTWYLIKVPTGLISDDALPTQTQVAGAFDEVRSQGFAGSTLARHAGASLFRLAFGLGIGSVAGLSLGLATGAAPLARTVIDPISSFFRMVPGLAVAPLILIWTGGGEPAIVAVVAFAVTWTAMGAAADARIRTIRGTLPDLSLEVISGMRSALLLAWATVLAIETVVASTGLGSMIWFAQDRSDVIMVGICVAGLIGLIIDTALRTTQYLLIAMVREDRGGGLRR